MRLLTALVILVLSSTAQAGGFLEIGTGYNRNLTGCSGCWDDAGANMFGAYLRAGYDIWEHENLVLGAHWVHLSQWFEGPPFKDESESSVDHVGIFLRYDF